MSTSGAPGPVEAGAVENRADDTSSAAAETGSATPLQVALGRLDGIHERPTHEQADLYQSVHTELQNALGTIDDA